MKVPLLDMKREWRDIRSAVILGWSSVLDSMRLLKGPNVAAFEEEMAAYLGVKHVVGVASGTDALTLGMMAVGIGVPNEVILPANTFAADVEAIALTGATPKLVDINEDDYGMSIEQMRKAISKYTKAVLVTHMYGMPDDLMGINAETRYSDAIIVEDASHAHGAVYKGKKVGTIGKVGCFSCGPVKNLGAYGDAGFVATDADSIAKQVRLLQVHGQEAKNNHVRYGFNSRLDELQAVVLRVKLKRLDENNAKRRAIAKRYDEAFIPLGLKVIPTYADCECVYHQYVVRIPHGPTTTSTLNPGNPDQRAFSVIPTVSHRDALADWLKERGIGTGIHYPVPLNKQSSWAKSYDKVDCPVAERVASEILSLPVFPSMTTPEVDYVIKSVEQFFSKE